MAKLLSGMPGSTKGAEEALKMQQDLSPGRKSEFVCPGICGSLCSVQFSISQGRGPIFRRKLPREIAHLVKAVQFSDFLHLELGGQEQALRLLQAELPQVLVWRRVYNIFEAAHAFRVTDIGGGCDIAVGNIFCKMLLQEEEHFFYALLFEEIPLNGRDGIFIAVLPDLKKNIRQAAADLEFVADISDYYRIDPVFGTNEQMEELIRKARERGMYVILDLVVNHCSSEHFWFREACRDPEGKYGKYFYIVDVAEEENPTNWRSYFGGPVWSPLPGNPGKKYLHVFHEKQPDLNWENEEVRREVYSMMKWWLDKGVRGFRVDAIMNIKKGNPLRSYTPDREDGLVEMETVIGQTRGIEKFLSEMKTEVLEPYDAFTVAEVCGEREEDLPLYMGGQGFFSSMFDFRETILGLSEKGWYDRRPITLDQYRDTCYAAQKAFNPCGFQTNVIENHDSPRSGDRFLQEALREMFQKAPFSEEEKQTLLEKGKKMMAVLYFYLHGIPCIYQGQEIGMENIRLERLEDINDVSALGEYGYAIRAGLTREEALSVVQQFSRDNARTPMQWDDTAGCGFTTGNPWIRINPNYNRINAAGQTSDSRSILSFYKKMISLRKDAAYRETFVYGSFTPAYEKEEDLMAYRRTGEKDILILANIGGQKKEFMIDPAFSRVLLNNTDSVILKENGAVCLEAFQALVLEKTC